MPEELKKSLGFETIFALIVTSMIGTSLFFGVTAGARLAGAASIISWVLLGIITIYVGACFAELISMYPSSGGVYEFTKQAFGRFPSFLVGWVTWIVANIGSAVLVVAAMDFVLPGTGPVAFIGLELSRTFVKIGLALVILLFFNYVTYRGIKASGNLLVVFSLVMLFVLVMLILPGFLRFNPANFSPFTIKPLMILATVFFLVESFFGWEAASFLAEETKDASNTIPKALLAATITVVILGVSLALMMLGAFPTGLLATDQNPILTLASTLFPAAVPVVLIGVFLMFLGGAISNIISSPRLLFALARDKLFIEQLTKIDERYQTPVNAIIFQTVVSISVVLIGFGKYEFLLEMLVPLALLMYAIVLLSIPVLRKTQPHVARTFKVWGGETLPVVVAFFYAAVVLSWALTSINAISVITLITGFIILSLPIYLFLTMVYNPDAIISINNTAARLNYALEDVLFPKSVRREIIDLFKGHFKGKDVVEFGAGVGTFTMHLADEVGPNGSVIAIDLSSSNLDILEGRAREKGHKHVRTLHDEHQINRLHPGVKRADIIYSVGFLGYVQDLRKILHEMHAVLGNNGKICFVEYTNFFKVLPDPALVSDIPGLEKSFRDCGFAVSIHKRKGLFWNYLIIHGIKTDKRVPYI